MRIDREEQSIADQERALDDVSENSVPSPRMTGSDLGPLKFFSDSSAPPNEREPMRWPAALGGIIASSIIARTIDGLISYLFGSPS